MCLSLGDITEIAVKRLYHIRYPCNIQRQLRLHVKPDSIRLLGHLKNTAAVRIRFQYSDPQKILCRMRNVTETVHQLIFHV